MRRYSQNSDNKHYSYLPPTGSTTSRNASSNSINRSSHYQYYDPRLRAQQQAQHAVYEYQYSITSPNRSPPRNQHYYQPPSFFQELPSSSTSVDAIDDLGEPLSIFDDIKPLEHRRSIVAPSLPSTYVPPDPSRRQSASDVRLATANALREQLLTDIQRSITDIDRELTALERRPSVPRYVPPRFSPIIELDSQDDNLFRQTTTMKPVSLPMKKIIPAITSPVHKQVQQTSAHSTATERTIGGSKIWPNKPKRVYEVIPSLTNDSRKASRQSSFTGQQEQIKTNEIQSPQSPPKIMEKNKSSSNLQISGRYHYGPEAEEIEILPNDPENIDHKSVFDEIQQANLFETLSTEQFLRDLSALSHHRALNFVPEYGGNSQQEQHESFEDLIENNRIDTTMARSVTATSLHDLTSNKELIIQDTNSLIQTAPEALKEPLMKPRIHSRNTMTPHELYQETETEIDIKDNDKSIISKTIEISRSSTTTPIATDDLLDKTSSFQIVPTDSNAIVPLTSSDSPTSDLPPPTDNNVSGLVAYFFSDFGNDGEGEEDISIDQNNFVVPTGAEIIADDDISGSLMGQSQASLLILHSAHVPRQQQQQQHTSTMPLTIENNDEYIEREEKESKEIDAMKKRIATATSILSSPSPSPKQVLPTSIIDDMQSQFARNNNANNIDHHRQPSTTPFDMDTIDSNIEEQEKRSNNSRIQRQLSASSTKSPMHTRIQSTTSERNDEKIEKNKEEMPSISSPSHTPLKSIDNERLETPSRIVSADERAKSSSRTLTRGLSRSSNHTKKDEEITRTNYSAKSSSKHIDRENSTSRRSTSRQPSITPSERSHSGQRRSSLLLPSSNNDEPNQSLNILLFNQPTTPIDDIHKTPTNENEPNAFSAENEHFLHRKSQISDNLSQRLPSGYSISHPNDSYRNSTESETLPVTLDSPDMDNTQPPTSRTATPMRKTSISSINVPPDPNVLLTTTDEPDPDDPSIINSTLHIQVLSSQQPNNEVSAPERNEPSPLVNIVPLQELPSELSLTNEHLHESSPTVHHNPTVENELEQNNELPSPPSPESDVHLPSPTPSHHEQEEILHRTPSSTKSRHEQESTHQTPSPSKIGPQPQQSSRQSPLLSYPARLEDLMRPTPSPFHSAHEHKHNEKSQEQHDRSPSVSSPINKTKIHDDDDDHHHHRIHENLSPKFQQNNIRSPSSSPRHSEVSDTNHTSVEGDETYRQQLDSPPISHRNEQAISSDHEDHIDNINNKNKNNHHHYQNRKRAVIPPPTDSLFVTENEQRLASEKSNSTINHSHNQRHDEHLYRNDVQLNSASIKQRKSHHLHASSSSPRRLTSDEEELPTMTASQQHSKLSLRVRQQEPKRKKSLNNQQFRSSSSPSPLPQIDITDTATMNTNENLTEQKSKKKRKHQRRRVSFSSSIAQFQMEERQLYANWRERVAAILASKHHPNEKYAHVQSRVNSFANFEYQPKKIKIIPKKVSRSKEMTQDIEQSKFIKRKKFKVKRPKVREQSYVEEQTDDDQMTQSAKEVAPQMFGRLWCLPDGSPTVFHESLDWNVASKLRGYSYENFNYEPHRTDFKIFNKKPKWHSESKLAELIKESPRFFQRQPLAIASSLPSIPDIPQRGEPYHYQQQPYRQQPYHHQQQPYHHQQQPYHHQQQQPYHYQQQSYQDHGTERKIFDIQTTTQQQSETRLQHNYSDNMSHKSSEIPIFNEKLSWAGKSKLRDTTWQNIKYHPKKSKVQIFHKSVHWHSEPKIRTRSPLTIHPSHASMSNVHIFDEKLNWDAQAKVHCWSEIDLSQLTKKKSIFAQYHDPKWNDIVTARIDATNYNYSRLPNHVEIFSDRPIWTRRSELKDYVWENFDYKSHRRTRQSNNQQHSQDTDQTPPNRPKWNAVSKTRSVNSVYNPKITNSNMIRRGWDRELRRKRVHKLPPLKRKRERQDIPQLSIDAPPSNPQLAIDYNYDHSSTQERTTSNGYATTSSRRSSKALVPLNHHRRFSELELPTETPRSQRPVQQEWYDEMNKSRLTHRTDMGRTTNHSFRNSIDTLHQSNTPRDLVTFRSSTRNSQNSGISGTLLDSSIRTNRTTEFRLSKDMDEHHHHTHTPSQSMPIEIRGFKLEGTQLSVPDHATIRPLSNISYQASERVKSRRVYPWSSLHPHGTSSRNSSLVPIAEFRPPSLDTTITEAQQLIHEE